MIRFIIPLIILFSCNHETTKPVVSKPKSVLILGNSIVKHTPRPEIGWAGNWGMAASVEDSDFVHILIRNIHQKDASCKVSFKNIADFENDYTNYNFSLLDSFKSPDIIIMRIGENVNDKTASEAFIKKYNDLINYLKTDSSIIIITDGFWPHRNVNHLIKDFAVNNKYPFIELADLDIPENTAKQFPNGAVAAHPNNKGMKDIAGRIWDVLSTYFY